MVTIMKKQDPHQGSKKNYVEEVQIRETRTGCLISAGLASLVFLSGVSYSVLVGLGYLRPSPFFPGIVIALLGAGLLRRFMPNTSRTVYRVTRQVK